MKHILNALLFTCIFSVNAQEIAFKSIFTDSLIKGFSNGLDCRKYVDKVVIDNDSTFTYWQQSCNFDMDKPDFSKYVILAETYQSDCLMRIHPKVFVDDSLKTITLQTENMWGGCRSGGRRELWIIIEKPGDGYTYVFEEIFTEYWDK